MSISVDNFIQTVKKCRSRETSGRPEQRSDTNPAYGQCLITALLANEVLKLDIYSEKVTTPTRVAYQYFNKNKEESFRFCKEQFDHDQILNTENERPVDEERMDVLLELHPDIKQRYEILKKKFQEEIMVLFS